MRVVSIKRQSRQLSYVQMDNGDVLPMSGKDILLYGLGEGTEVDEDTWQSILGDVRAECLRRCGALLSGRDYSEKRLREKLLERRYPEEVIGGVIGDLKEAGYLDDRRMAESFVRLHTKDRSIRRMRADLAHLGIGEADAARALAEVDQDEEIRQILEIIRKKGFDPACAAVEEKDRFKASLYRKGYEAEAIRKAVRMAEQLDSGQLNDYNNSV